MTTTAQEILIPPQKDIFRAVFLYVGQGESTLLFVPNGDEHLKMLIDSNQGKSSGGINLIEMLKDLCDGEDPSIDYFVNTHPHMDHAGNLDDIREEIDIKSVWHSGHRPGKKNEDAYKAVERLRDEVNEKGGEDITLEGTRETQEIGEATYNVLSPAKHVQDEISDEDGETRYRRIHEHCAVLRFGYGESEKSYILITGDSDKTAWKEHITDYHGTGDENRLESDVLSASHHGSRTFFKESKDDEEPYKKHMDLIDPTYLVISAPTQEESPHDHPHDDALDLYKEYVNEDDILHTGENKISFVCDINAEGQLSIDDDNGDLAETYGFETEEEDNNDKDSDDSNGGNNNSKSSSGSPYPITRIDERGMG